MDFKYKTAAEIEAMTEYQREKYFDQKREFEDAKTKKLAAEGATAAVAQAVETAKAEITAEFEQKLVEEQGKNSIIVEELDKKYEAAMAEMNRTKAEQDRTKIHSLQGEIHDFFSTDKGEEMLKNFTSNKSGLRAELANVNVKAVGTINVTAGTVAPDFVSPVGIPHEVVQARNVIPVSPTGSDLIKYVQFTKKEGRIGSVSPGGLKPQIDYNSAPVSAPVIKLAGWLTVVDEFLEDVVGARDFLAQELPKAYMDEETRQAFFGMGVDAAPDELDGLYTKWASDLVLPKGSVTTSSNNWDKLAAGLCQVRRNLRATDAIWLSPEDYMELLINKSTGATQLYDYPITSDVNGTIRLGGVPIYQHSVFAPGQGIAGDFSRGARFFQKKGMTIRTSTEHDVNFTHNLTTLLIEARVALACFFPDSFVKFDLNGTS